jgi:hypothetical protein
LRGEFRPGIRLDKDFLSGWYAVLTASMGFRTRFTDLDGSEVALKPRLQIVGAGGPAWDDFSLTFGLLFERESGPSVAGVVGPNTTRYRTAALAVASHEFRRGLTGFAGVSVDLPFDRFGQNEPVAIAPSLGLRYSWDRF